MALNTDRRAAILSATFELLTEVGYDRMSIDQIARRAGASKATIYRRWSGKAELVTDLVCQRMYTKDEAVPDTGSLRDDLLASCEQFCRAVERKLSLVLGVLPAFLADPELARALRANVPGPGIQQISQVLERAQVRGELAGPVEPRELHTVLDAVVWRHLLLAGAELDESFVTATVDRVLLPLLAAWTRQT